MGKRLIAILVGSTMALTTLAITPARAQSSDELGRAIAGAITFFVIGNAIASVLDETPKSQAQTTRKATQYFGYNQPGAKHDGWNNGLGHGANKPHPGRKFHKSKVLPRECFFVLNHGREKLGAFGATCLEEFLPRADRLPKQCAMTMPVRHGRKAKVYNAGCLRAHGYRSERYARY